MTQALTQTAARSLALFAVLGFTALVGLAALEPAAGSGAAPARPAEASNDATPLRTDAATPRFERSNEPAIEADPANAHGG
jgi:hypothetical protein